MNFREFLLEEERREEERRLEEGGLWDVIKGGARIGWGLGRSTVGLLDMGDEALSRAVNDPTPGRFRRGWERFTGGIGDVAGGIRDAVVGPKSKPNPEEPKFQPPQPEAQAPPEASPKAQQAQKRAQAKPDAKEALKDQVQANDDLENVVRAGANSRGDLIVFTFKDGTRKGYEFNKMSWSQLFKAGEKATDSGLKRTIQASMAMRFPRRYKMHMDASFLGQKK